MSYSSRQSSKHPLSGAKTSDTHELVLGDLRFKHGHLDIIFANYVVVLDQTLEGSFYDASVPFALSYVLRRLQSGLTDLDSVAAQPVRERTSVV